MEHEIDLKKYNIRTDLIIDSFDTNNDNIKCDNEKIDGIDISRVVIDDDNSCFVGKKSGTYTTICFDDVTDSANRKKVTDLFSLELKKILDNYDTSNVLIVGLGNSDSTPDSLGPKVLDNILVTRHLFLLGENTSSGIRKVSSISPGVMADTGIETVDIVSSIVSKVNPSLVIVIDALAAGSISRINKSIQITDTGIHPGSGIGNMRKEISIDTINVPVIGIGVPTVVSSSTIVYDTLNYLFKHISYIKDNQNSNKLSFHKSNYLDKIKDRELSSSDKSNTFGIIGELSDEEKRDLIVEVLGNLDYNFIVTPKEVDFLIDKLSLVLSEGINKAIHDVDFL